MEEFHTGLASDLTDSKSKYRLYLNYIVDLYVKNYLYRNYLQKTKDEIIIVRKVLSMNNNVDPILKLPDINFMDKLNLYMFNDLYLFFSVSYSGEDYELNIQTYLENIYGSDGSNVKKVPFMCVSGITPKADRAKELTEKIISIAVANSPLKLKSIRFDSFSFREDIISAIEIVDTPDIKLNDLYVPEIQKYQIKRFIDSVNQYQQHKISLRYLLNGKPGTGKTQLINAIITGTKNLSTKFICVGGTLPMKKIIEFCNGFVPCILIIDDVDFIAGDRYFNNSRLELGEFLQALDGFLPNNIFLLAATNDKKLVDVAASRPGRFDLILDITEIEPKYYRALIKRETDNPIILNLFDDEALNALGKRRISGAFIVSLVKQIRSSVAINGSITKEEFYDYLNLCYKGFYSVNNSVFDKAVGFET